MSELGPNIEGRNSPATSAYLGEDYLTNIYFVAAVNEAVQLGSHRNVDHIHRVEQEGVWINVGHPVRCETPKHNTKRLIFSYTSNLVLVQITFTTGETLILSGIQMSVAWRRVKKAKIK